MAVTNYYTIDGQMIGYKDAGGRKDFLTDVLGSVTGEVDQTGTNRTFNGRYKPYGGMLWSSGSRGTFGWIGTWGYKSTGLKNSSHYVRARHYSQTSGIWTTTDPLWPNQPSYSYVKFRPIRNIDPEGLVPQGPWSDKARCNQCALSIREKWFDTMAHYCNHAYTHCMSCCLLSKVASPDCARGAQYLENVYDIWAKGWHGGIYFIPGIPDGDIWRYRDSWCATGIKAAELSGKLGSSAQSNCSSACSAKYPDPVPELVLILPLVPSRELTDCEKWKNSHPKADPKLPDLPFCDPVNYMEPCREPISK